MAHLLATSFLVQLGRTRPPLPLTWEKLNKQEVRRPGTSCLPSNGPLVPRGGTEIRGLLQVLPPSSPLPLRPIQSLQDQCFGCEFCLTPFLPPEPPANRAKHNEAIIHLPIGPQRGCNEFFHDCRASAATHRQLLHFYAAC